MNEPQTILNRQKPNDSPGRWVSPGPAAGLRNTLALGGSVSFAPWALSQQITQPRLLSVATPRPPLAAALATGRRVISSEVIRSIRSSSHQLPDRMVPIPSRGRWREETNRGAGVGEIPDFLFQPLLLPGSDREAAPFTRRSMKMRRRGAELRLDSLCLPGFPLIGSSANQG